MFLPNDDDPDMMRVEDFIDEPYTPKSPRGLPKNSSLVQ